MKYYNNNANLKAAHVSIPFTEEQVLEYTRCAGDPIYFIRNYAKIVSLDEGIVNFNPFPYQIEMIETIHNHRNTLAKLFRQSGKSTIVAAYVAWYVLFNENKTAVILANKQAIAIEIFSRVQFIIEGLPQWLQQGVEEWNKKSLALENGSRCVAAATSPSAVRGMSCNLLVLDEFAHLNTQLAEEFMASVFPTISSGQSSKLVIISTPNGLNHFYKLWINAENGSNDFKTVEGRWQDNPLRSQQWADEQRKKLGDVKYRQEIECSFEGSSYTLIDGVVLSGMLGKSIINPIFSKNNLEIFEEPSPDRMYVMTVDVARGRFLDYSAFSITDVTELPYRIVATYKDNSITTIEFPHLIFNTARQFNDAYLLIEINDNGQEVANALLYDYEYENIYFTNSKGISEAKGYPGIRTTMQVKTAGCAIMKDLIEKGQLLIPSFKIIEELGVYVLNGKTYSAEDRSINDDLCTTIFLLAWLVKQSVFQEVTNVNLREELSRKTAELIDSSMTPFGFYDDGTQPSIPISGQYDDRWADNDMSHMHDSNGWL